MPGLPQASRMTRRQTPSSKNRSRKLPSTVSSRPASDDVSIGILRQTSGIPKDHAELQIGTFQGIDVHYERKTLGVIAPYRHPPGTTSAS